MIRVLMTALLVAAVPGFAWGQEAPSVSPGQTAPAAQAPAAAAAEAPAAPAAAPAETLTVPIVEAPLEAPAETPQRPVSEVVEPERGFPSHLRFFGEQMMEARPVDPEAARTLPIAPFYEIGPGDELVLSAWGSFDLNLRVEVNDQGYITLPRDQRVYVSGLTFKQVRELALERLRSTHSEALSPERLASGEVSFEVTLGRVRGIQVMLVGQVNQPGGYSYPHPLVLLTDALAQAGGISRHGSLRSLRIRRGDRLIEVDLYDLLTTGDMEFGRNLLQAGDVVTVPYRELLVSIDGRIQQPGIYELKTTDSLADLIDMAGGLAADAVRERIQIRRVHPQKGLIFVDVDLSRTQATEVRLQDQDQVMVRAFPDEIRGGVVFVEGPGVVYPGTYELTEETAELRNLLQRAELYEDAVRARSLLIRMGPDHVTERMILNLDDAVAEGFQMQELDRLFISSAFALAGGDKEIILSGHVKQPGEYTLARSMTLFDVLYTYSGLLDPDFRARTHMERGDIMRLDKDTGRRRLLPFHVESVLNMAEDMELESSDEIRLYPVERFQDRMQVSIEGEVRLPGEYELTLNMNLGDLVAQAGGLTEDAQGLEVEVARLDPTHNPPYRSTMVSMEDRYGFVLRNHDMVFVRRLPFWDHPRSVMVQGEVRYPGRYVLTRYDERLSEVLERAGGLSEQAFLEGVQFTRRWNAKRQRVAVDLARLLEGRQREDVILRDGDEITIPASVHAVQVRGAVQLPGLVRHTDGRSVDYYLERVGGVLRTGDTRAVRIERANGLVMSGRRRFWFNPSVPPGATIVVPERETDPSRWRVPGVLWFAGGAALTSLGWYVAQ